MKDEIRISEIDLELEYQVKVIFTGIRKFRFQLFLIKQLLKVINFIAPKGIEFKTETK